ncbi:MAG: 6-phosphogluconolactonase [Saprospiraceae bacterium]|nr:6-phosphogluconolactonase [Saprospiraceae bacterium]
MHVNNNFKWQIAEDYEEVSRLAASYICASILSKSNFLLCTASGNTPRKAYDLVAEQMAGKSFRLLALDEWAGLSPDNPYSSAFQLNRQLVEPLDLRDHFLFNGKNENPQNEIDKVQQYLSENGPIDLCVLGIGTNGHLGFNEPRAFLEPVAHLSKLSDTSRSHSMIAAADYIPEHGLTLGIGDILRSKKILLVANGSHKRDVLSQLLSRHITPQLPASFLWLHHDVTCICDKAALP